MNEFFANFYEIGELFHPTYSVILVQSTVYAKMGLMMLGIPLLLMAVFYFAWKYPFGRWWHWSIWWLLTGSAVALITYVILRNELITLLYDPVSFPDCKGFVLNLILVNAIYGLLAGFIYSLAFKRFSKSQGQLPFVIKSK